MTPHARALAVAGVLVLASLLAAGALAGSPPRIHAGPMKGQVPPRGQSRTATPDLLYHGGPVMASPAAVTPIYWGSGWSSDPQNKEHWLNAFYSGMSGSHYAGTNSEYTQTGGAHVATTFAVNPGVTDLSAAPAHAPGTSDVLAEVARAIKNPVANGYYPVYTDTPRGHARYCAWHSAGTIGTVTVQFAFFFDLDNDPGCDPQSSVTAYGQGVAALANVSGHELSEALTDPQLNAWFDATGEENADKCAWTFGSLMSFSGTQWKVQGNWSNAAGGCIFG